MHKFKFSDGFADESGHEADNGSRTAAEEKSGETIHLRHGEKYLCICVFACLFVFFVFVYKPVVHTIYL